MKNKKKEKTRSISITTRITTKTKPVFLLGTPHNLELFLNFIIETSKTCTYTERGSDCDKATEGDHLKAGMRHIV